MVGQLFRVRVGYHLLLQAASQGLSRRDVSRESCAGSSGDRRTRTARLHESGNGEVLTRRLPWIADLLCDSWEVRMPLPRPAFMLFAAITASCAIGFISAQNKTESPTVVAVDGGE